MLAEAVGVVHRAVVGLRSRGLVSTSIGRTGLVARVDVIAEPTGHLARLLAKARRRGDDAQAERILVERVKVS